MPVNVGQLPGLVRGSATIEVLADGQLRLLPEAVDPRDYSNRGLVYFFDGADNFMAGDRTVPVINATTFPSIWGTPTFFDLTAALEHYRDNIALRCRCPILASVWHDENRWLLRNRPEETMQESLHSYLISTLRAHQKVEVRREQPAGGRKPPDIKVTWTLTNRLAFIEVKWMGASVSAAGDRISWQPAEDEANRGAGQLVGYLDENAVEAVGYQTMGYLVVFDGRRRGVQIDTEELAEDDAHFFLAREIAFDAEPWNDRHDCAQPFRCFMHPKPVAV
jgi:hypothetical protein